MSNPVPYAMTHHVRDHCLCLAAQRAARTLARRFDSALRPVGLTSGQFSLMMGLNRPTSARMRDLVTLLAMDRTTLTAMLKPLERRSLIASTIDADDRRNRFLTLTPAGVAALAEALPIWQTTHALIESTLPDQDGDMLRAGLRGLAA